MINKKRIVVFLVFLAMMFFLTTFAGEPVQNASVPTRDVIFTDSFDGVNISEQKVEVGKAASVPETPKHKDYVFTGWYEFGDHDVEISSFDRILEDTHALALYKADINNNGIADDIDTYYNVTFVDAVTKAELKAEKVLVGMDATAPEPLTHANYEFEGWDKDYTNVRENLTVNGNYRYTAPNVPNPPPVVQNTYVVTFVDGLDNNKLISKVNVREGLSATAPTPPKHTDKVFKKWNGTYTNVKQNQTVVAVYADDLNHNGIDDSTEPHYTVEFTADKNGKIEGTAKFENILTGLTYEEAGVTVPKAVPNDYYVFDKWDKEFVTKVTENQEYVATFKPEHDLNENGNPDELDEHYTVEFKAGRNGKLEGTAKYEDVLEGLTFAQAKITVPTPTPDQYYLFDKWDSEFAEKVNEDLTYTASFKPEHDEISENGGPDGTADELHEYKLIINYVFSDKTTPEDHGISNVNETRTYDKRAYSVETPAVTHYTADKEKVEGTIGSDGKTKVEVTVTYTKNKYVVTFVDGDTNEEINKETVESGNDATLPTPPKHEKRVFTEWQGTYKNVTKNETVTAIYKNDKNENGIDDDLDAKHTVTFKADRNGKLNGRAVYTDILTGLTFKGATIVAPTPVPNEYYVFDKWTPTFTENQVVDKDLEFVASFKPEHDENNNGNPDELDKHYTVEFKAEGNGKLEGTTKYEDVLEGLTFAQAKITVPTPTPDEYYKLDKWDKEFAEKVNENLTYTAKFVPIHDELSENGGPDGTADELHKYFLIVNYVFEDNSTPEDHDLKNVNEERTYDNRDYKVTAPVVEHFYADPLEVEGTIGSDGKTKAEITIRYRKTPYVVTFVDGDTNEEITKVTVYSGDNATLPTPPKHEKRVFIEWQGNYKNVTKNETVTAIYKDDKNSNGVDDEKDPKYTVKFEAGEHGKLEGTLEYKDVLVGFKLSEVVENVPTPTPDKYYVFDKWTPEYDANKVVEDNLTYKASFKPEHDENNNGNPDELDKHYTVEFKAEGHGKLEGTTKYEDVLEGLTFAQAKITVPTPTPDTYYKLDKWDKEFAEKVNENLTYTAKFVPIHDELSENGGPDGTADELHEYKLIINYVFSDKTTPEDHGISNVNETRTYDKRAYSVETPAVTHYTADIAKVEGTIGSDGKTKVEVTVTYTKNAYTVTFVDGDTSEEIKKETVESGNDATLPTAPKHEKRVFTEWQGNYKNVTKNETVTAIYKDDKNENGVDDEKDPKYTVKFEAEAHGKLEGTLEYKDVLVGFKLSEVVKNVPTPKADTYYVFDKWTPEYDANKVVEDNLTYKASFKPEHDENNNGNPDELDKHYTVEFKAEGHGKLEGTTKYEDVLEGLTFEQAKITVPTPTPDEYYKLDKWDKEFAEKVNENLTYTAVFKPIHDELSENGGPDGTADELHKYYVVVNYVFDDNTTPQSHGVTNVNEERTYTTRDYSFVTKTVDQYTADKAKVEGTIGSDGKTKAEVTVTYKLNKYTVTFVDYDGKELKKQENVPSGTAATAPANPTRTNWTFKGWDKDFSKVTSDLTVKAEYTPNQVGIEVEEKPNVQFVFQKGSTVDLTTLITVYRVYADGSKVETTEYTNDLTTEKVVDNKTLTIRDGSYTDTSIKYKVQEEAAAQTKFEVKLSLSNIYRETKNSTCTKNCDSTSNTREVSLPKNFLEVIEHYDENIEVTQVKVYYDMNKTDSLVLKSHYTDYWTGEPESVRWSRYANKAYYDPAYIYVNNKNKSDVSTTAKPIKLVDITYNRKGYGDFIVTFEYKLKDGVMQFVAIDEVKVD